MSTLRSFFVGASLAVAITSPLAANAQSLDPRTAAAIEAVETQWTRAEVSGNVAFVDALLLPEYRSVSSKGAVHTKADIVADTVKNGKSNKMRLLVAQYMKAHPYGSYVTINGDAAIVTFYSDKLGPKDGVMSSDVFLFRGGRWRAWYSQHTGVV